MRQSTAASVSGGKIGPSSAASVLGAAASVGVPPSLWALPPEPSPPVPVTAPPPPVLDAPPLPGAPPLVAIPPVLDASPLVATPPVLEAPPLVAIPPVLDAPPLPDALASPVPPVPSVTLSVPLSTLADSHAGVAAHMRPARAAETSARLGETAGEAAAAKVSNAGLDMKQ